MNLTFIGDVMLGRLVNEALRNLPPEYPWGNTPDVLNSADVRFCNLECVVSDIGKPWSKTPKVFHFRTDKKNTSVLESASLDVVSIANNHSLDYGEEALLDMIFTLEKNNILYAGAGENIKEAMKPVSFEVSGYKIGMIAFTDNEPIWEAGDKKAGIFYVPIDLNDYRAKELLDLVEDAKMLVDIMVVSAHWGPNWGYDVPKEHVDFAHTLVDHGADVVFGHSPHVFRAIEIYRDLPILYSCGNYIDDYVVDLEERNDQSFIFTIEVNYGKVASIKLFPTMTEDYHARLATLSEANEFIPKMQKLCDQFNTKTSWRPANKYLEIKL